MKVLVCGGRHFNDFLLMQKVLDQYKILTIVNGACSGADILSTKYAGMNNICVRVYPANWKKYGARAGPMRNSHMLTENKDIDLVIAFPGGRGTLDMINKAKVKEINVLEVENRVAGDE